MPTGHIIVYNISLFNKKNLENYYLFCYFIINYWIIVGGGLYFLHLIINILEYKNFWFVDSYYE